MALYGIILQKLFYNFFTPTGCNIYAMDLKIFPNINMLLKVYLVEGFSNWNNVDELGINKSNGCNCNNYNLTTTQHGNSILLF